MWQPEKNRSVAPLQQWPEAEAPNETGSHVLVSKVTTNPERPSGTQPGKMNDTILRQDVKNNGSLPEIRKVRLASGKTLRLLAQDLFGDREFWVYIYLENKSQINNPNSVPAGTELIVPDRIKYGINAADSGSVAKAKSQGNKILQR